MNITEVSRTFGLSIETLRYYERIGLIPKVHRKGNGYRDYTEEDLQWIYYAKVLRKAGVSIDAMTRYIALARQGDGTVQERLAVLRRQRRDMEERLAHLREAMTYLDIKISRCEEFLQTGKKRPVAEEYRLFQKMGKEKE